MNILFEEKDLEILISTMNRDSLDFLVPMFPSLDYSKISILIINQVENETKLNSSFPNIRVINSFEKGLSKSRNLALQNAIGNILLISDDDVMFQEGFAAKIIGAYNKYPNASTIKFCALKSNKKPLNKYSANSKSHLNAFDILNTSSIELTLNKFQVDFIKYRFDENFGLRGIFEMGEEAVFLSDLKKDGKQLVFEPEIIVAHNNSTSSEKRDILDKYFISGALFTRIFKEKYIFWIFIKMFFDLKQKKIKFENIKTVLKSAKNGHEKFERIQHENK
ncbi:glycosyltransferase family 2 protein [Flavobacterium ginsenosidimutans]|uniref:Glycosyltransferase family A protein n=1 Tax=Flavobacterium ginsenosidimutans TaxID=687844 RepID=A0ABZ2Q8P9_9FLAO|nr:glycosyltransferase family A protein [Flavobacterium ginsenosidimutans]KAF2330357.1 glycosyltransferase family 2 protein [Flavobacterium ginsenosidimutans]